MHRWLRTTGATVATAATVGCAYYNGVYNAKHFAGQAEYSERQGRTSEAAERWRIAAIHAESVATRHPRSRWLDEALLIRSRALIHLEAWSTAEIVAQQALRASRNDESRCEAWLYLGLAEVGMRQTDAATAALDSAALSRDARRRSEAYLARGRVLLAAGRPADALADLRRSKTVDAIFERARAALGTGDVALATATADTVAQGVAIAEALWLPFLDSLGNHDAGAAYRLTDELAARTDVRSGPKARLLLADGARRLAAGEDSAGASRFAEVRLLVPDSVEARAADLRLARLDIAAAKAPEVLAPQRRRLAAIALAGGAPAPEATDLVRLLDDEDSLGVQPGPADAWWFFRGELLRDSLGARHAAAEVFARMATQFPGSPWTPKGLLAAIDLGHPASDSLRALLATRYADSPYTAAALGRLEGAERFALLEDSLRVTILSRSAASSRGDPTRAPAAQDDEPGPGRRPVTPRPAPRVRPTTRPTIDP